MVAKPRVVRLVSGFTIDDVAEACRSAAIEFLDGVRDGWGKKELAKWLTGSYHQLSLLRCSADELAFSDVVSQAPKSEPRAETPRVPEQDIENTMRLAREEVLAAIRRFAAGDEAAETFLWRVKSRGGLARVEDENGTPGLVPNEQPSQRLVERVLSLIAADYVARPLDYEERAAVCASCGSLSFQVGARAACDCGEHRGSGMRPRIDVDARDPNDANDDSNGDVQHTG